MRGRRRDEMPMLWSDAPSLPPSECWTLEEAVRALGIGRVAAGLRAMDGHLRRCKVDGQVAGYTRASVERELAFWRSAPWWRKVLRRIGDVVLKF